LDRCFLRSLGGVPHIVHIKVKVIKVKVIKVKVIKVKVIKVKVIKVMFIEDRGQSSRDCRLSVSVYGRGSRGYRPGVCGGGQSGTGLM
jgi:hypothetical protein